jgi:signal transduction histidine kinase
MIDLLQALVLHDLGPYAAAMAFFAAGVCFRANPRRDVNVFTAAHLFFCGAWQILVALARVTHDPAFWGPLSSVPCLAMCFLVFLMHDACVYPSDPWWRRLRRPIIGWLTLVCFCEGFFFGTAAMVHPGFFPWWTRPGSVLGVCLGFYALRAQRRAARSVNGHELTLFRCAALFSIAMFAIYALNRTPLSSRLNTLLTITYLSAVIGYLLTGRVFDAGGSALLALRYLARFAVQIVCLYAVIGAIHLGHDRESHPAWVLAAYISVVMLPLSAAADWVARKVLGLFSSNRDGDAVRTAMRIIPESTTERDIVRGVERIARSYLRNAEVSVTTEKGAAVHGWENGDFGFLARHVTDDWLTPGQVILQRNGELADALLRSFATARLGAVLRCNGHKATVFIFVGFRSGGAAPITTAELEVLHELATIASAEIDRLRSVEDRLRVEGLARIGRIAADLSHSARNHISAIQAFVEAAKEGQEALLTPEYCNAVYEEVLALAANHNFSAASREFDAQQPRITVVAVDSLIRSVVNTYRLSSDQGETDFQLLIDGNDLVAHADESGLRQVLLNLIRNAVQATQASGSVQVRIRAWKSGGEVHVEVTDNGPGVPAELHDRLFTAWATSKPDGTGLGLAFCREALRAMGGRIIYGNARGTPHACFLLALPMARPEGIRDCASAAGFTT